MSEPKIILVTDLEGDVDRGVGVAGRVAAERGATLVIVHVVDMTTSDGEGMMHHGLRSIGPSPERRLASLRTADPSIRVVHVLETGDPEAVVADLADSDDVVMLVMEVRRRPWWRRAIRGSLTERLIRRVRCSVMTYRGHVTDPEPQPVLPPIESEAQLTTLLNARVDAVVGWMRAHRERVRTLAESRSVRHAVASLSRGASHPLDRRLLARVRRNLELELAEHRRALPALGVEVVHHGITIVRQGLVAGACPARDRFLTEVEATGAGVSLPLEADEGLGVVIDAAAIVPLPGGDHARLSFALDARRDFFRILDEPGPEPTAETYAFDESGMMLSNSRFAHQLRGVGLLPADPRVQTPRRLRICDPGGNLLEGYARPDECPLTRMARDATAGHDGADWRGYRDYRGVEVVGAWRWIDDLGFGVAAEIDRPALH